MKNITNIISASFLLMLCIQGCKKETVVKPYSPTTPTLYGTWQTINTDISNNEKEYFIYSSADNFGYILTEDEFGFRESEGYTFSATDKQFNFGGSLKNYSVKGDTLKVYESLNSFKTLVKISNPSFNYENWTNTVDVSRNISAPDDINSSRSFGINGDFLYFYNSAYADRVYKLNTLNNKYVDSMDVSTTCGLYYKSGTIYYGFNNTNFIFKSTELQSATLNKISTNKLYYVYTMSFNGNSNTIYAYQSNDIMFAGTEDGTFSELFKFSDYNTSSVVYYKNDEFLAIKDYKLYRVKISPTFKVVASYKLNGYDINNISTNGVDVWACAEDNNTYNNVFLKLNLN